MRVFVTGSDGYIGTVLTPVLAERGHAVVGLDARFYGQCRLYDGPPPPPRTVVKDIRRITPYELEGFDAVVHMAELSNDPLGRLCPAITRRINHQASVELARNCRRAGVERFVYTSSCSVYGTGGDDLCTEASEPCPQTIYARCKVMVERDVGALADDRFSPTFLRNATVFGASPRMRFDLVLNNLCGVAWTTGEIRMTSDGTPWRPLVHVRDVAEAIACTLEAPREAVHGRILNVGRTSQNHRVRDIAEIVAEWFPGCRTTFGRSDGDSRSYRVSFDRIHEHLPTFRCRHDARAGAGELRRLFERMGLTREEFRSRRFTRLEQIQHLLRTRQIDEDFYWRPA